MSRCNTLRASHPGCWLVAFALSVALIAGCAAPPPSSRFGVATQVADAVPCVNFAGPPLAAGTPITIEAFEPPQRIAARISARRGRCAPDGDVPGIAYSVEIPRGIEDIGLAVATLDAGGDAELDFRSCSSNEGVHLTAWRQGARIWHQYFHLPYDIDSNCTPEQTGP